MHYIEYLPGTIARITDHPTRHGHADVNLLSRWVSRFNLIIAARHKRGRKSPTNLKLDMFESMMQPFLLPCSS